MGDVQSKDQRTFATEWLDVAIQITRRGNVLKLMVSRVFANGEQSTVELPLKGEHASELQEFWGRS